MTNIEAFRVSIDLKAAGTQERARRIFRAFGLACYGSIVVGEPAYSPGTPVDTGFARSNWQVSLGAPDVSEGVGDHQTTYDWDAPFQAGQATILSAELGETIAIANGAAYIVALEYGHSQQAPQGMVQLTANAAPEILADVVAADRP